MVGTGIILSLRGLSDNRLRYKSASIKARRTSGCRARSRACFIRPGVCIVHVAKVSPEPGCGRSRLHNCVDMVRLRIARWSINLFCLLGTAGFEEEKFR
jgi:hypothetical protein